MLLVSFLLIVLLLVTLAVLFYYKKDIFKTYLFIILFIIASVICLNLFLFIKYFK